MLATQVNVGFEITNYSLLQKWNERPTQHLYIHAHEIVFKSWIVIPALWRLSLLMSLTLLNCSFPLLTYLRVLLYTSDSFLFIDIPNCCIGYAQWLCNAFDAIFLFSEIHNDLLLSLINSSSFWCIFLTTIHTFTIKVFFMSYLLFLLCLYVYVCL